MKMASCRFCFNSLTFNAWTQSTTQQLCVIYSIRERLCFYHGQNSSPKLWDKIRNREPGFKATRSLVSSTLLPLQSWSSHMKSAWIRFIRCMGNLIKQKGFLLLPPPLKICKYLYEKAFVVENWKWFALNRWMPSQHVVNACTHTQRKTNTESFGQVLVLKWLESFSNNKPDTLVIWQHSTHLVDLICCLDNTNTVLFMRKHLTHYLSCYK